MKIEIIDVNYVTDDDSRTLDECGFKVSDVVEVSGRDCLGRVLVRAIRNTDMVRVGNLISIMDCEYKVIEE